MNPLRDDPRQGFAIDSAESMEPFLMAVVSGGDRWMYPASTGALTAGRRDPDGALFPYETDDRLLAADGTVGPRTVFWVQGEAGGGGARRWEPFLRAADGLFAIRRRLWKSVLSDEVWFEEHNEELGLTFRYGWRSGEEFGFVRRVELRNDGPDPVRIRVLDGLLGILPAGVRCDLQTGYSNLVDAYKIGELLPESGLALFRLGSIPTDRAIPSEALTASAAWVRGLPEPELLLSGRQLRAFRLGEGVHTELHSRGRPGALLACAGLLLEPGECRSWTIGCDTGLDARAVVELQERLGPSGALGAGLQRAIAADLDRDRARLVEHVAGADGLQVTASPVEDARHLANTLFNVLRGGTFVAEGRIRIGDFARWLRQVAPRVAARHGLSAWPSECRRSELVERGRQTGDPDLERLAREYLPLTFSRRHGDPSRPWNRFSIETRNPDGSPRLRYEGNWRDIFQNWEALLHGYPAFAEAAVVKFVNASTRDGHNPYRIDSEGFDWEVPDPQAPWAHIGYWGDHQIVYLQRLLDLCQRLAPGSLGGLLRRRIFVFADVPYRIASYRQLLADPQETIAFDGRRDAAIRAAIAGHGNEARLLPAGSRGEAGPLRAALGEKLLVPILAKLDSFVPGLGIWMNTQRPEWNDANNALAGRGVSVVTAAHLLRHCQTVAHLFAGAGDEPLPVTAPLARHLREVAEVLAGEPGQAPARAVLDRLGEAGSRYREAVYGEPAGEETVALPVAEAVALLERARHWLQVTVRANLRDDGLLHAYNLLEFDAEGGLSVRRLPLMLEGQVAALASGALQPAEAADLLDALARSPLRRQDLGTYLLYPDRPLAEFLTRGVVPAAAVAGSRLLLRLLQRGDDRILRRDRRGVVRFAPALGNAAALRTVCEELGLPAAERQELLELYERVFDHTAFTGRSGTFFGYEGLGCVYWHLVSKLRLAVLETWLEALQAGAPAPILARLREHYEDIRKGLGIELDARRYGAFPSDPYSHTPADGGVRQPGMTGQVKEDLIARRLELGLWIEGGRLGIGPALHPGEALQECWRGRLGRAGECALAGGEIGLSLCGVPVRLRVGSSPGLKAWLADGTTVEGADGWLDVETSRALFERTGAVREIEVGLPEEPAT